ncbi:MAG: Rab family GTPase [Candidatus Hermodarchaeota archaeon]
METNPISAILFIEFGESDIFLPVLEVPSVLSNEIKEHIGRKCLSILIDEKGTIPRSIAIIPFPSYNLKGMIKYMEWEDDTKAESSRAAIAIVFKETDDLIFYKYINTFDSLLQDFIDNLIRMEKIQTNRDGIELDIDDLLKQTGVILTELKEKELSLQEIEQFPEDQSLEYDISEYGFKVIVIGDPEVGKTSVVLRFTDKAFLRTYIPTLGVNISAKNIRALDSTVQLIIWDVAGQSKFHTMRKHFYKGAEAIILVFDLTKPKSFENINKWFGDIKRSFKSQENLVIYLVGNKGDLKDDRKISEDDAEALAEDLNITYLETSALSGENIMFLFHKIGELLLTDLMSQKS